MAKPRIFLELIETRTETGARLAAARDVKGVTVTLLASGRGQAAHAGMLWAQEKAPGASRTDSFAQRLHAHAEDIVCAGGALLQFTIQPPDLDLRPYYAAVSNYLTAVKQR